MSISRITLLDFILLSNTERYNILITSFQIISQLACLIYIFILKYFSKYKINANNKNKKQY